METQAIVKDMADDSGVITPEMDTEEFAPSVDIDINIRQDDLQIFETTTGRQLLRTSEMKEGMFIEPVPSKNGFVAEIVFEPDVTFSETEPATPAEQPSVKNGSSIEIRMD